MPLACVTAQARETVWPLPSADLDDDDPAVWRLLEGAMIGAGASKTTRATSPRRALAMPNPRHEGSHAPTPVTAAR
jgi:hypothetical protein